MRQSFLISISMIPTFIREVPSQPTRASVKKMNEDVWDITANVNSNNNINAKVCGVYICMYIGVV